MQSYTVSVLVNVSGPNSSSVFSAISMRPSDASEILMRCSWLIFGFDCAFHS